MHSPFRRAIFRTLVLINLAPTVVSCGAAPPNQDSAQVTTPRGVAKSVRSTPVPTAASTSTPTPSVSPSPTPTPNPGSAPFITGPIELRAPKEPIRVEAAMKPVEAKPIEIKPVQIQLPNQDLHVTAAGIPDKIKVEWDVKPLPVDLRWPKDPVKLSVDVKSSSTEPKDSELSKRVKALETEIANDKNQINTLNEKLTAQRDNYRDAIERTLRSGGLAEEKVSLLMKQLEIQKTEWWGIPIAIFGWILISGILGGVSISIIESFRQRRKRLEQLYELEKIRDKLNAEVAAHAKILNNDKQRLAALDRLIDHEAFMEKFRERHKAELGCWKLLAADWIPAIILGIVAALMVPAVLYFVPGKSLQAAAQNQYLLISLCSICFVVALVGELFIAAVLYRLRNHLQEWADK